MPPSRSAVSPTKLMNWVKRSASRRSDGAGSVQSRMAKPLCGNLALDACARRGERLLVGGARPRGASRDRSSGSGCRAAPARCAPASRATSAASAHKRGGRRAGRAAAPRTPPMVTVASPMVSGLPTSSRAGRAGRARPAPRRGSARAGPALSGSMHRDLAIERVGVVDGLHLDQRALAVGRRAPWRGSSPNSLTWPSASSAARSSALAWRWISSKERSPPIKRRPCRARACVERGRQRADRRHGGDAKRDAEHEDGEAAGAGAELAQRDRERKRQPEA